MADAPLTSLWQDLEKVRSLICNAATTAIQERAVTDALSAFGMDHDPQTRKRVRDAIENQKNMPDDKVRKQEAVRKNLHDIFISMPGGDFTHQYSDVSINPFPRDRKGVTAVEMASSLVPFFVSVSLKGPKSSFLCAITFFQDAEIEFPADITKFDYRAIISWSITVLAQSIASSSGPYFKAIMAYLATVGYNLNEGTTIELKEKSTKFELSLKESFRNAFASQVRKLDPSTEKSDSE